MWISAASCPIIEIMAASCGMLYNIINHHHLLIRRGCRCLTHVTGRFLLLSDVVDSNSNIIPWKVPFKKRNLSKDFRGSQIGNSSQSLHKPCRLQFNLISSATFSTSASSKCQSKALVLLSDLKELKSSPRPALIMGFCGIIPFALPPFYFISSQQFVAELVSLQLTYGAVTLSFLGGIQWGYSYLLHQDEYVQTSDWKSTSWSMIPCLIGWASLLVPLSSGLVSQMVGHGLLLYRDMSTGTYPSWFRALRFVLSILTIMTLWTSCVCSFSFEERKKDVPGLIAH